MNAPWLTGTLTIRAATLVDVERIALEAYARNEEACGYLTGPAADVHLVDEAVELQNLANRYHAIDPDNHPRTGREYFKINSLKFERAVAQGQQSLRPIKVFFHSHLDCGAYFSDEDAASMTMDGGSSPAYALCYLVTAVDLGKVSKHRLFRWDDSTRSFVEATWLRAE